MVRGRPRWSRRLPASAVRLSLTLLTGLVAALAASGLSTASATSGEEVGSETITATLEPGDNFVGWISDRILVDDVFAAIPKAALIYTWDGERQVWRSAIRDIGGSLTVLEPGMAAMIRIDGTRSVRWERPLTPAKGMVTLYRGVNWVTWVGRDDWPLDEAARGIGKSLVSIRVGDTTWPAPFDANADELPSLRRGDAVEVVVNRDLKWLQPTGMMPNVVFVGDISELLQQEITEDIGRVLDSFAQEFGVETDFSDTTILLYNGIDALVEHAKSGHPPALGSPPEWLRGSLLSGRTAQALSWGFFMSVCGWQPPGPSFCHGRTVGTLIHEWFHVAQRQLSGRANWRTSPVWMNEGAALWAELQLLPQLRDSWSDGNRQRRLERVKADTAPLEKFGDIYAGGRNYILGLFAVEQLVATTGLDAVLEFNRQLYPQIVGKEGRWEQRASFAEAFEAAFGASASQFYRQYAAWRKTLSAPSQRIDYDPNHVNLSGTLHYNDGSPATGFIVMAEEYEGEVSVGVERYAIVDEAGAFTLDLAPDTIQRFWFRRDGCVLQLSGEGPTMRPLQPGQHRDIDTRNMRRLNLTLPEGACENELRARVTTLRDDDRYIDVLLIDVETHERTNTSLGSSGAYTGFAPKSGEYRVRVRLGDCGIFYSKDGMVASRHDADVLHLSSEPVAIEFRVPHDLCVWKISGRIVDEDGDAAGGGWIQMVSDGLHSSGEVSADGRFAIEVPDAGDYVLFTGTDVPDCHIVYASSGGTANWRQAEPITVADEDVAGIEFIVPENAAELCR